MSGISSSVGLVSGLPVSDLIDQLMKIESRVVEQVAARVTQTETVKTAWMGLSAGVLGTKMAALGLNNVSTFTATTAASSNESVMTATTSTGVTAGTYQFTVRRLAQNHQLISTGFADAGAPVGAGALTFDIARGRLDPATRLDFLNGQQGVRRGTIRITDRTGASAEVSLLDAVTVADVLDAINDAGLGVRAVTRGDAIVLQDTTGVAGTLTVAEVGAGRAAEDLGLLGQAADAPLVGADINGITAATSLDLLNDGLGIERAKGVADLLITLRDGASLEVSLLGGANDPENTAYTVGDVLDAINNHAGNGGRLVASISADGNGITLVDTTGGGGDLVVANGAGSKAATQLGLEGTFASGGGGDLQVDGRAVIASLNSVLLRNLQGGAGLTAGVLELRDRLDNAAAVDVSGLSSVADVLDAVNDSGLGLVASLNDSGTGLKIADTTGSTDFRLVVADAGGGTLAAALGIAVDADVDQVAGGNAQLKYISGQTKLSDLAAGGTWPGGSITITNSQGASVDVNVGGSGVQRVADVIQNINGSADRIGVSARLNDSGTGILLEDASGGAGALTVQEKGSTAARTLGLLGSAGEGEAFLDGSLRTTITLEGTETLTDLAAAINDANFGVTASVINDQSSVNPYRLMLVSRQTGTAGRIVFDAGDTGIALTTFAEARDALVYLGSPGQANAVAVSSSTNQLAGVVEGVTFDLRGTDDDPVTVTISTDDEAIVSTIEGFITSFNGVIDSLANYTRFDPETLEKGVLFGDAMTSTLKSRLVNMVLSPVTLTEGRYSRLAQVGVTLESGQKLALDEDKLRAALQTDRDSVISLFTEAMRTEKVIENGQDVDKDIKGTGGIGVTFQNVLDSLTDDYDGLITNVTDGLDNRIDDMKDRIGQLNTLLEAKRERYERQFASMETAIARMQGQMSALNSLASIASQMMAATQA
ncbi:MAG: flagellar filament capping protein FliD [Planctomycetes bacterium]|nr:flagellar filament capping protein FliD [Planctomycetota bacterium]